MAAEPVTVKLQGWDDLIEALKQIVPKLRYRAARNALAAGGRLVRQAARANLQNHTRTGLVAKSISVRTSKTARKKGDVGVFVNVRPARGKARGRKTGLDPFYWRFLEFDRKGFTGIGFLKKTEAKFPQVVDVVATGLGKALAKLNTPKAPPP